MGLMRHLVFNRNAPETHFNQLFINVGGTDYAIAVVPINASGQPTLPPVFAGALVDGSGTIAANNVSQQVFAANANRRYLLIQNNSSIELWVNIGAAATIGQPSIRLFANGAGSIVFESTFIAIGAVNIIGAMAGAAFTAKEG